MVLLKDRKTALRRAKSLLLQRKEVWDNNRELQTSKRTPDLIERERWDMSVRDGDGVCCCSR